MAPLLRSKKQSNQAAKKQQRKSKINKIIIKVDKLVGELEKIGQLAEIDINNINGVNLDKDIIDDATTTIMNETEENWTLRMELFDTDLTAYKY